ncbi:hypothetical protein P7H22_20755 [Paenibacillus larvae]|nr:hypothetical protein [Paenibacillus larvae]MDT2242295.1 hypothetical protein [Paenibacillus larvae]
MIRLIGALLDEQDEKWAAGKKYLDMDQEYMGMAGRIGQSPDAEVTALCSTV